MICSIKNCNKTSTKIITLKMNKNHSIVVHLCTSCFFASRLLRKIVEQIGEEIVTLELVKELKESILEKEQQQFWR